MKKKLTVILVLALLLMLIAGCGGGGGGGGSPTPEVDLPIFYEMDGDYWINFDNRTVYAEKDYDYREVEACNNWSNDWAPIYEDITAMQVVESGALINVSMDNDLWYAHLERDENTLFAGFSYVIYQDSNQTSRNLEEVTFVWERDNNVVGFMEIYHVRYAGTEGEYIQCRMTFDINATRIKAN